MSRISPIGPPGQKPVKLTPMQKRLGKKYMARVKELPCIICGAPGPSDAHHGTCRPLHGEPNAYIIEPAAARKSSDFDTMPLCKTCHQDGPNAIHNGKESWVERNGPDYGYIPVVRAELSDMDIDF